MTDGGGPGLVSARLARTRGMRARVEFSKPVIVKHHVRFDMIDWSHFTS